MAKPVSLLAVLAAAVLSSPALAQPGAPLPTGASEEPPPVNASTVVIVTPSTPIVSGAAAGPGQAPGGPPQNEPWGNVSHINGQLVKVGERSDYLYDHGQTTNISTNPIGWMFGFYGVSVAHAVHPNVALRGDVNWFSFDNTNGYEVGVSAPIYFRRTFQGPFLEPGLMVRNTGTCSGCSMHADSMGPEVMFGWHWSFDSGLNVAMAFGAMRNMNTSSSSIKAEPAGYFRIGYAM